MRTITKKILSLLLGILLFAAFLPTSVFAIDKIEPDRSVDLTIRFADEDMPLPGAYFRVYRVAEADERASMTLTEDFKRYKNTIAGMSDLDILTQEQWGTLASTLFGYVLNDNLTPLLEEQTDEDGCIFAEGLEKGLYLVIGSSVTDEAFVTYTPAPFLVFLPAWYVVGSGWNYDVTVSPKYEKDEFPPERRIFSFFTTCKVLKQWDDEGYESIRPEEITVQLLRNGEAVETQVLNKENNWRYAWDNLPTSFEWTVIEEEVDGYVITIEQNGVTYVVTNRYSVPAPIIDTDPPVQKRIIGDEPEEIGTFAFVLTAADPSYPMPENSDGATKEIAIEGAGRREFGKIDFTEPGTYVYTVSERNGGLEGYTYDSTVYTLTYTVTEEDGELSASGTILDDAGNNVSVIEFTNKYQTPGGNLPQTGVLWWPVPVLFLAGCAFVVIGIVRRRRCNG